MALAVVVLLTVAACGTEPAGPSVVATSSSVPSCQEIPRISAPPDAYAGSPIYVANEMPIEDVQAWARLKPGFESIWIDRERNGWITLAFREDAAARQAEVRDEFPGVGVVVVEVPWTMDELRSLQERVHTELGPMMEIGSGILEDRGVVEIDVAVLTDEIREAVTDRFGGERVCLEGGDPADFPPPGPQPQEGEGWRLLVNEVQVGWPYRTGIATDPESLRALWGEIGLGQPPPEVDFGAEVVVWFGAVFGSSCPDLRLDDVVVEGDLVYPLIVLATPHLACTDDANPMAFVVAVERSMLPVGRFTIQLGPEGPPSGASEERTIVDANLTIPGAVAGPDQVGPDPALPRPPEVASGDYLEPGFATGPYHLYAHCGIEWLGVFNDFTWRTDEAMPDEWSALMTSDQTIDVELLLLTDPEPVIEATAGGVTVTYRVTDRAAPGCD